MNGFETTWARVIANVGKTFHTKEGLPFIYKIESGQLCVSRTNYPTSQANMKRAFARMPCSGPSRLRNIRGRAYVWAILKDARISNSSSSVSAPKEANVPKAVKWYKCVLKAGASIAGYAPGAIFLARKTLDGQVEIKSGLFYMTYSVADARRNFSIVK